MTQNKVKEEFERKFRNKPVGSRLIFGTKKNPFPQHGFKYDPPAKKKITGASFQRNNFYRTSPQNGFMQVGQPADGMFASLLLASKIATLDAENLRGTRPPVEEVSEELREEILTNMRSAVKGGVLYERENKFTGKDMYSAFRGGLERRAYFTELARNARGKMGRGRRGQPSLDEALLETYKLVGLRKSAKPADFDPPERTSASMVTSEDLEEEQIMLKQGDIV